jgi:hypothetical protein
MGTLTPTPNPPRLYKHHIFLFKIKLCRKKILYMYKKLLNYIHTYIFILNRVLNKLFPLLLFLFNKTLLLKQNNSQFLNIF